MKIVAIAGSQIPSDTANSLQVMKACNALVQLGHDLTLIVPEFDDRSSTIDLQKHYGLQTNIHIEYLSASNRRLFTWQSVQRARALKPDLLYVWMIQSAVFGLLFKLPTVFEIHIQPTGTLGPAWHRAFAKLRGRKCLASITQALVDVLERKHNIRFQRDEVVITPNGVDLERFASLPDPVTARQQLNFPNAPTVMCTGHLYAGRGADLFLALAKELQQAHFIWVGGKPEDVETWKARAQSDNVTFTGFIPNQDLPLYQSAADVLLMPYSRSIRGSSGTADSGSVASPMKMFEYMAAGRAIVTADLLVIREVLNEKSAVFCEPDDLSNWKLVIGELLTDEPRRVTLGKQAMDDVQGYTWLARAEKIMRVF
ncbi:MAG: glycosyltransferase [Anaerolineales bacterium]|nr:glycosyltransferase [Anaerolineales bacterium]